MTAGSGTETQSSSAGSAAGMGNDGTNFFASLNRRSKPNVKNVSSSSSSPPTRPTGPARWTRTAVREKKKKDEDDDSEEPRPRVSLPSAIAEAASSGAAMNLAKIMVRLMLGSTVALYLLNQKHMLPKPIGAVVSRALFWPTLPITVSTRIGKWVTEVDDVVVMGGAPFGFVHLPERLHKKYRVRGVVNMCDEYAGPTLQYDRLGITHLWLRTVDHFEPSVEHLKEAVSFLIEHENEGDRVYVHCRAGHGRSAAVALAWLLYRNPKASPKQLNQHLCSMRNVRKTLWQQPNILEFQSWLQSGGRLGNNRRKGKARGGAVVHSRNGDDSKMGWDNAATDEEDSDWSTDGDGGDIFADAVLHETTFSPGFQKSMNEFETDYSFSEWDEGGISSDGNNGRHHSSEDERDYELWKRYRDQQEPNL